MLYFEIRYKEAYKPGSLVDSVKMKKPVLEEKW
jgi:hypothetical protein